MDREIKISPKMEKRLLYLGFEEKDLNIQDLPEYKIEKRYFVHPSKLQIRIDVKDRTLTILNKYGEWIDTRSMFLTSEIEELIKDEKEDN